MRSRAIYPRRSLRFASERPSDAWELAAEIRCGGISEKLWRRIAIATPVVCVICGNEYAWYMDSDSCPYCGPEVKFGI
jgi:hypothetical protein